jgi:hypothetical protein
MVALAQPREGEVSTTLLVSLIPFGRPEGMRRVAADA